MIPPSEDENVSNETWWTNGVAYTYEYVENSYVEKTGEITSYSGWTRTPYLYCEGASKLRITPLESSEQYANNAYNCFYDADKNFISYFDYGYKTAPAVGEYKDIDIPANAKYFIVSGKGAVWGKNPSGYGPYLSATPIA